MKGKTSLYGDLGVQPTASQEEIRAAYRKRAKISHPDAGGSSEAFRKLSRARKVLSDPAARAHYDETGEETEPAIDQTDTHALGLIGQMMDGALGGNEDPVAARLIDLMITKLEQDQNSVRQRIAVAQRALNRAKRMERRFKKKSPGDNRMQALLDATARNFKARLDKDQMNLKVAARAIEILKDHTYDPELVVPQQLLGGIFTTTTFS